MPVLGRAGRGWGCRRCRDRVVDFTLSPNFGKLRRKRVPSDEKGGNGDPHRPYTASPAREYQRGSHDCPLSPWSPQHLRETRSCGRRAVRRGSKVEAAARRDRTGRRGPGPAPAPRAEGTEVGAAPPTDAQTSESSAGGQATHGPAPASSTQHPAPFPGSPGRPAHHCRLSRVSRRSTYDSRRRWGAQKDRSRGTAT